MWWGLGRRRDEGTVFGGHKTRRRGVEGGSNFGGILRGVNGDRGRKLVMGRLELDGDLVFDGALEDEHLAFSPPDFGVEEPQEGVAQDNAEVGRDDSKGQGESELPQSGAEW